MLWQLESDSPIQVKTKEKDLHFDFCKKNLAYLRIKVHQTIFYRKSGPWLKKG